VYRTAAGSDPVTTCWKTRWMGTWPTGGRRVTRITQQHSNHAGEAEQCEAHTCRRDRMRRTCSSRWEGAGFFGSLLRDESSHASTLINFAHVFPPIGWLAHLAHSPWRCTAQQLLGRTWRFFLRERTDAARWGRSTPRRHPPPVTRSRRANAFYIYHQ
jgi:hypothetical protein